MSCFLVTSFNRAFLATTSDAGLPQLFQELMIRQRLLILCQTNSKELKSKKDNLNFFWDKEPVTPSGKGPSPTAPSSDHGAGSSGIRWVTSNSTRWHIGHLVLMYCFMPLSSHSCPNCPSENMSDRLNWHSAQAEWSRQQWDWRLVQIFNLSKHEILISKSPDPNAVIFCQTLNLKQETLYFARRPVAMRITSRLSASSSRRFMSSPGMVERSVRQWDGERASDSSKSLS